MKNSKNLIVSNYNLKKKNKKNSFFKKVIIIVASGTIIIITSNIWGPHCVRFLVDVAKSLGIDELSVVSTSEKAYDFIKGLLGNPPFLKDNILANSLDVSAFEDSIVLSNDWWANGYKEHSVISLKNNDFLSFDFNGENKFVELSTSLPSSIPEDYVVLSNVRIGNKLKKGLVHIATKKFIPFR